MCRKFTWNETNKKHTIPMLNVSVRCWIRYVLMYGKKATKTKVCAHSHTHRRQHNRCLIKNLIHLIPAHTPRHWHSQRIRTNNAEKVSALITVGCSIFLMASFKRNVFRPDQIGSDQVRWHRMHIKRRGCRPFRRFIEFRCFVLSLSFLFLWVCVCFT